MPRINRNLKLVALAASLFTLTTGCQIVGEPENGIVGEIDCVFNNDHDDQPAYEAFIDGREVHALNLYEPLTRFCDNENGCRRPTSVRECELVEQRLIEEELFPEDINLQWMRTDTIDPDDTNRCIERDPMSFEIIRVCSDGSGNGDDDDDDGSNGNNSNSGNGDDDDDDGNPGPDGPGDDIGDGPGDDAPDNGEPWVEVCYDLDDGDDPLEDSVMDEVYLFNHPDSGWFNGSGIDLTERSGNRHCFDIQCGTTYKWNAVVNGSNVYSVWHEYAVHNTGSDSDPEGRQWGQMEPNDDDIEELDSWMELYWIPDGDDMRPGYDGYVHAECD